MHLQTALAWPRREARPRILHFSEKDVIEFWAHVCPDAANEGDAYGKSNFQDLLREAAAAIPPIWDPSGPRRVGQAA